MCQKYFCMGVYSRVLTWHFLPSFVNFFLFTLMSFGMVFSCGNSRLEGLHDCRGERFRPSFCGLVFNTSHSTGVSICWVIFLALSCIPDCCYSVRRLSGCFKIVFNLFNTFKVEIKKCQIKEKNMLRQWQRYRNWILISIDNEPTRIERNGLHR